MLKIIKKGGGLGMVGLLTALADNMSASTQAIRNIDARNACRADMDKCPECSSGNYNEEIVEFVKGGS